MMGRSAHADHHLLTRQSRKEVQFNRVLEAGIKLWRHHLEHG